MTITKDQLAQVEAEVKDGKLVLRISGELDINNGHMVLKAFENHYDPDDGISSIVFDLSPDFLDAHTFNLIHWCLLKSRETPTEVVLRTYLPSFMFSVTGQKLQGALPLLTITDLHKN